MHENAVPRAIFLGGDWVADALVLFNRLLGNDTAGAEIATVAAPA